MPKVWNKRNPNVPAEAVLVDRTTRWGNPFHVGRHGARSTVIAEYRKYLLRNPDMVATAKRDLRGKDLVCWCAPQRCHADVLLEIANAD